MVKETAFSLYEAVVWALRSVLDNVKLFIGLFLAAIGIFAAWIVMLLVFARVVFFWHHLPAVRDYLSSYQLAGILQPRMTEMHVALLSWFGIFIFLGMLLMGGLLLLGYAQLCLRFIDGGQQSRLRDLFSCWRQLGSFICAGLIFIALFAVGLSLFIIPGIYVFIRFGFFKYLMVDTGAGVIDSLRGSYQLTAGHEWQLFGMLCVAFLFVIGGTILLFPAVELLFVFVYRKLRA